MGLRIPGTLAVRAQSPKLTSVRLLARTCRSSCRLSVVATAPSTNTMSTASG